MVTERFLNYVKIDTESDENSTTFPSTAKQFDLARVLYKELTDMGASDCYLDEQYGYVYAKIPATDHGACAKTIGFIAHMDTSPDTSGANVQPRIVSDYDGNDIVLNEELNIVLATEKFPELKDYVGQSLIVTDGTTLLGADDKAGIAEIMTMAEHLLTHPEISHGPIAIAFTPDEEVGQGTDYFDLERFGADFAYTVDGGRLGELEYENFNAASATIHVKGVTVHPGSAKDKMINAGSIAAKFDTSLPALERPEHTEGYEGFYHLLHMSGSNEEATLEYIIRDHDMDKFNERKETIHRVAQQLNAIYGERTVTCDVEDSYFNMKEKILPEYSFLIDGVKLLMEELSIEPHIQPIRGGTDGARLSYLGLPCPNLCAGGHNFHGRYEFVCVETMHKIVDLLIRIATDLSRFF